MVKDSMLKVLELLYHRSTRRVVGMTVQHKTSVEWEWPSAADALDTSGIWTIN